MKSLEELKAIREKMQNQVSMRAEDHTHTRVVVGMATCGRSLPPFPIWYRKKDLPTISQ